MALTIEKPSKSNLIVKSNQLINAEFRLTPVEMKIIYLMATQVKNGDEDFKPYYLRIQEFKDDLNISGNSLNKRLEDIIGRLMRKIIKIRSEGDLVQFPLLIESDHGNNKGIIALKFNPKLKPHLLDLKEKFTSFYDHNVIALRSTFSMRIYEFLKQYEKIGYRVMTIQEMKLKLELVGKYRSYNAFKNKVILQAQGDLNGTCDITFDFKEIKKGRKVDAIKFLIISQRDVIPLEDDGQEMDENQQMHQQLADIGLSDKQIRHYLYKEKLDHEYLKELIQDINRRSDKGTVRNPAAYLITLIDSGARPKVKPKRKKTVQRAQTAFNFQAQEQATFINRLHEQFSKVRREKINKLVAEFSQQDWEHFRQYASRMYGGDSILKGTEIDTDSPVYNGLMGAHLGNKLPEYGEDFMAWAAKKGYQLQRDPELPSNFYLKNT